MSQIWPVQNADNRLGALLMLHAPGNNAVCVSLIQSHCLIDDAITLDGIGMRTSLVERFTVDLACEIVNESPLEYRTAHGGYLVLGIRIEIVADALALSAIVHVLQRHSQFQCLHEEGRANHIIVVKGAPTAVGVLMSQFALAVQKGGI